MPEHLNHYISLDAAETEDRGDDTFMVVWGVSVTGRVYAVDIWHGQVTTDVWTNELIDRVARFQPLALVPEHDNIFKAVEPFIRQQMRKRNARAMIAPMPHGGRSKEVRAQAFQGIAAMGDVSIPDTPAGEYLLDQLLKFPAGRHDDGVDACAALGRYLHKIWEATPPRPEQKPPPLLPQSSIRLEDYAPKKTAQAW